MRYFKFNWDLRVSIIAACVLLFIIPWGIANILLVEANPSTRIEIFNLGLYYLGALRLDWVWIGSEWWRLVNSNFLHIDWLHLGLNMLALWQIGKIVQSFYGQKMLWVTFVVGGITSSLLSILLEPSASVGASGAIFALIGLLLAGSLKRNRYGTELPFTWEDIWPMIVYSVIMSILIEIAYRAGLSSLRINNWAHLGGLLGGMMLGFIFPHLGNLKTNSYLLKAINILAMLSTLIVVVSFIMMAINFYLAMILTV